MEKVNVKLLVSRAGPVVSDVAGSTVEVDVGEASRLLRQGAIERPSATAMKAIATYEAELNKETAAAAIPAAQVATAGNVTSDAAAGDPSDAATGDPSDAVASEAG